MSSGVPLTKEKIENISIPSKIGKSCDCMMCDHCIDLEIDNRWDAIMNTIKEMKKLIESAVCWRNNLERVPHSEFYACSFCASNMHAEVIIEDKIKQSKKYACSVCATNRAFGIENKDVKK